MKTLIMALFYQLSSSDENRVGEGAAMLRLWQRHLRGPGQFDGEIAVVSNCAECIEGDVDFVIAPDRHCRTIADVQLLKAVSLCRAELAQYDSVLYLDLDILAVAPVAPLFATSDRFCVGRSSIAMFDSRHSGCFLHPFLRAIRSSLPLQRMDTANTCALSYRPEAHAATVDLYREALLDAMRIRDAFPLGDQTVFNWALWQKRFQVDFYDRHWIQHSNWQRDPRVILWHFPTAARLSVMKAKAIA